MTRKIEVPMHSGKFYHPELKAALLEGLEPFPGTPGRPFAMGVHTSVDRGRVEMSSNQHAWWVSPTEDTIVCGDMLNEVSREVQKHCAHVAFATVGDNRSRAVLRDYLSDILEVNEGGPGHADFDVLFFRQGILAHFTNLTYELVLNGAGDPGVIDLDVCRSGIVALYPEDASHHEKMAFLQAVNGYLSRKIVEDLARHSAESYRHLFDGLEISLVY